VNISYHPFYATSRTKHDNMSTISITKFSSLERSTLDFSMLKPQKTLHSLNIFFAHDSTCLLLYNLLYSHVQSPSHQDQGCGILEMEFLTFRHTKTIFNNVSLNFKCTSFKVQMNNGTQNVEET